VRNARPRPRICGWGLLECESDTWSSLCGSWSRRLHHTFRCALKGVVPRLSTPHPRRYPRNYFNDNVPRAEIVRDCLPTIAATRVYSYPGVPTREDGAAPPRRTCNYYNDNVPSLHSPTLTICAATGRIVHGFPTLTSTTVFRQHEHQRVYI
jgi:hypothetical protein